MMMIPTPPVWTPSKYTTIPDLLWVHTIPVLLKIWWRCINNSPEPGTWVYTIFLVLLCCRKVAFSNHQIVHGLLSPSSSHPEFLKFWCSRHETALSVSASGGQTWGISGHYSVAEDASVWGLRKSRDASQPVKKNVRKNQYSRISTNWDSST